MTTPILEATGTDGTVRVYENHVELVNKRLLERVYAGEKSETIPRDQIASVKYRDAGRVRNGIIKILPVSVDDNDIHTNSEPYAVRFHSNQEHAFQEVRDELRGY